MALAYRVVGLRELLHATDAMGKDTKKLVRLKLREAAEPVRQEATALFTPYDAKSARSYGISVRRTGVVSVEQRLRKTEDVARRRPKFGTLQMKKALVPALDAKSEVVADKISEAVTVACAKFNLGR